MGEIAELLSISGKDKQTTRFDREYTQSYIPLEKISDGVVITRDRKNKYHYLKILKIIPLNFALKSADEQDAIILNYAQWLKGAPNKFQLKVITKRTNIDEYISLARAAYNEEPNEGCRRMILNYIQFLRAQGNIDAFEKHYYLTYEYENDPYSKAPESEAEVVQILNYRAENIKESFRKIGNDVTIYDMGNNSNTELMKLFYEFYNRKTSSHESFRNRLDRIESDSKKVAVKYGRSVEMDIRDLIAPKSIDFSESSEYMVIDGSYRAHFFIRSNGYPSTMNAIGGWLNRIINFGYGFDTDIFFFKTSTDEKLNAIRMNAKISKGKVVRAEDDQMDYEEIVENYQGTLYMKQALKVGGEDVYDMVVMVTIQAFSLERFHRMRSAMMREAVKMDVEFGSCKRFQIDGFESTGFFLSLSPKILRASKRNITTSGVAASYAFTSFSLSDKNGVAIGFNRNNHSLVVYDPLDAYKYKNSNITIYGASGHGKTYALLTILSRLRCLGVQCFALAPDKQDEFRRITDALGGVFVDLSPSSPHRINVFDIRPMDSPATKALGGESYTEKAWLIDKVDNLKIWLRYLIPDLTLAEETMLDVLLMNMYSDFGITEDNESIYYDSAHSRLKDMPIMTDFYKRVLAEKNLRKDISIILSRFISGAARNMNGQTNVDLSNKFVVFGLENLKGDLLAPTLFMLLEYVWAKTREDRTKKKMIAIDEGWQLLNGKDAQVGEFVQEIFKVIRGFGGGAIFSTQSITDLFQNENNYGNAILSCSHSKIILGMERKDLSYISDELGLNASEADSITKADAGEALLCAGPNHVPIKIKTSEYEHQLFTTRREDLEKLSRKPS